MQPAASRPSAIAQTTRDCPRAMSPAEKTFGTLVRMSFVDEDVATLVVFHA